MTLHDARSQVGWRKAILLNRATLVRAWDIHFPSHDFNTLRLHQPAILAPPHGWDEQWTAAARKYHEERSRQCRT